MATPNLCEAALLAGVEPGRCGDVDAMADVARRIHAPRPDWVLVKGGHLPGVASPAGRPGPRSGGRRALRRVRGHRAEGPRVATPNTHGTGCSLSAAIAARLAGGDDVRRRRGRGQAVSCTPPWSAGRPGAWAGATGRSIIWGGAEPAAGPVPPRARSAERLVVQSGRVMKTRPLPPPVTQDPSPDLTRVTPPLTGPEVRPRCTSHCEGSGVQK